MKMQIILQLDQFQKENNFKQFLKFLYKVMHLVYFS